MSSLPDAEDISGRMTSAQEARSQFARQGHPPGASALALDDGRKCRPDVFPAKAQTLREAQEAAECQPRQQRQIIIYAIEDRANLSGRGMRAMLASENTFACGARTWRTRASRQPGASRRYAQNSSQL